MTRQLRLLWPEAPTGPTDPSAAEVREVLAGMPPRGQFVFDRPDEPDRAEHYLQVERSGSDADHWMIEIRHGDEQQHLVTSVGDVDTASSIVSGWLADEQSTPPAPRWWLYRGGNAYADRSYLLTAYIAGAGVSPLWHRERLRLLVPDLEPLLATGRGRTSVRSLQDEAIGRSELTTFGAMTWSRKSEEKWTHLPTTTRVFHDVEIAVPSRPASYRQGIAPDVVFRVAAGRGGDSERFSVLVATADDMTHEGEQRLHDTLRSLLQPVLVATKRRPYGIGLGTAYMQPLDEHDPVGSVTATAPEQLREDQPVQRGPALERWRRV